eukprot:793694-Rhodomonas_salina.1
MELTLVRVVSDPALSKPMSLLVRTNFGRIDMPSRPNAEVCCSCSPLLSAVFPVPFSPPFLLT